MTTAAEPQFLTVCEAAALLNVNEQTHPGFSSFGIRSQ